MSFLKNVKANKPTASLEGYFVSMLAPSKFGKTTFAVDLVREFYKGDMSKGLLLATEIGYRALDGIYAIPITGFDYASTESEDNHDDDSGEKPRGFIEVVDELIENKADVPFRFIVIDTVTALERLATSYAIRLLNREDSPKPRYSDISDVPWGKGYNRLAEEIYKQIDRLKVNGFGVFLIGHSKTKKIKDLSGFEYDFTTFNAQTKTSDIIERESDMIIYGDIRVNEDESDSDGTNVKTERKLMFRSNGSVLCGTRFRTFPSEIDSDAKSFVKEFENAILKLYDGDEVELQKEVEKQDEKRQEVIETKSEEVSELKVAEQIKAVQEEISEIVSSMAKSQKMTVAKMFEKNLGMRDFKKSEDLEQLQLSLEEIKEMEE